MINDLNRHEKYKELSRHIYYIGKEPAPNGTIPLYVHENKKTGFFGCAGSYPVSSYTRSDGAKVSGYARTCGAKHGSLTKEERLQGQAKYKGKRFQDIPSDELEIAIGYFI